ncbi:MAG TPA: peptidylprolyl isomerase [Pyrinomonadaceae bacterium]|jgi:cyclophilin family peptidyl-prolyl cis-trans isomerase
MIKNLFFFLVFSALAFALSCDNKSVSSNRPAANAEVKRGVAPVADPEVAVIDTDYGAIKIELYSNVAPKAVARFKELAREGVYNGTTFHRINESVVQGGDPLSKDDNPMNDGTGKSDKPDVPAEFSDIPYDTGIVGAARSQDVNSANSQFFITLRRVPDFDTRYTIFGKVIEGMNNVMVISGVQRERERPIDAVKIKSVTIQPK